MKIELSNFQLAKRKKNIIISVFLFSTLINNVSYSKEVNDKKESVLTINSSIGNKIEYKPVIGKHGGKKVITSFSAPITFNYYLAKETSSINILDQMYEGLVFTDPITTEIKPALAESWSITPDKKTYIVKMKKDLFWSDGEPITADDVIFTFNNVINNPNIETNSRDLLLVENVFPKVEKIDNLTIKFTTHKPFAPFERLGLGTAIVPKHILQNLIKKDSSGNIPFNQWGDLNSEPKTIVCNGPFKLKEYITDKRVVLERNDKYWRKDSNGNQLPYLDEFITEIVDDSDAELIKFKSKESDLYFLRNAIDYENLKSEQISQNFRIINLGSDEGALFVMFNQSTAKDENGKYIVNPVKSSWFKNRKFRQALAHAIDKQRMIKSIYKGLASPQISDISQQSLFYNPNVTVYDYDLKKASKKLKEAGFKKNKKGELFDYKGNRVEFNLVTNSGNQKRDSACRIISSDWEKLGIKVNYKPIQFNSMVRKIDETLEWDAMMIGLTGNSIEPHNSINTWRLTGQMHMFNIGNSKNNFQWKGRETSYEKWEKDLSLLWEQASKEFDKEKRINMYKKAQKIVSDNVPFLYTVNKNSLVAVRNNIGNVFPNIKGGNGLNSVNWNSFEHYIKD